MAAPDRLTQRALVVGSGWGALSARALVKAGGVELVGVVGRGSARTQKLAQGLGVPCYGDLAQAIEGGRPTMAVVSVGERENPALMQALFDTGCHVLCSHPVARTAAEVAALADAARARGLVTSTDYTFALRPEMKALHEHLQTNQGLLRLSMEFPGRWMPIALHAALTLAGPAASVAAFASYPEALRARAQASPQAFAPSLVLVHEGGVVSCLTPVPHATTASACRITASTERGAYQLALPSGGLRRVQLSKQGASEAVLVAPTTKPGGQALVEEAMSDLVRAFVVAVESGQPPPCPLHEEQAVRAAWQAMERSVVRGGASPVSVPTS